MMDNQSNIQFSFNLPKEDLDKVRKASEEHKIMFPSPSHVMRVFLVRGMKWVKETNHKKIVKYLEKHGMSVYNEKGNPKWLWGENKADENLEVFTFRLPKDELEKFKEIAFTTPSHMMRVFVKRGIEWLDMQD